MQALLQSAAPSGENPALAVPGLTLLSGENPALAVPGLTLLSGENPALACFKPPLLCNDVCVVGYLCSLLNWRVPFLSWMAILVFLGGTVLFYLVPIRYVILVWGINKYTKRLRTPNYISNNELLDFLSRCPTNKQLQQWQEFPLALYHRPPPNTKSHKKSIRKTK